MKALVVTDVSKLELQTIEKPKHQPHEVLVKVAYCGVCGSDLPRYFEGAVHNFPQILGHEFSGIVEEVGSEVSTLKVGDKVAVAPLIPCMKCSECQKGNPAMCLSYSFIGSRQQGAMAEYVAVPAINCVKSPDNLSLQEAAMIEPLTVAIHGIERVSIPFGASVLVFGAGTIGLLTLLALKARGAGHVTMVDLNQDKLNLARFIGADAAINLQNESLEDFYQNHPKPEIVMETSGSHIAMVDSIRYSVKKTKIVFVGTGKKDVVIPPDIFEIIVRNELEITGSWMSYSAPFPGYEWTSAIEYMASGKIDVKPLITGTYSLDDIEQPFEDMVNPDLSHIKLMYKM